MLETDSLNGKQLLDIGSGSGLSSLAAYRLGATVTSFDYDPQSVECTDYLRRNFAGDDVRWRILQGSILDNTLALRLGQFDIVYSWGVLHHTGNMALALSNAANLVGRNGLLFIALYNDQGWISTYWTLVKRAWVFVPAMRPLLVLAHAPYLLGGRWINRFLRRKGSLERGMNLWHDMIDWLGGYPFEVATPDEIVAFALSRNFSLLRLKTCGGRPGCNEFVFRHEGNAR
jgi:2-polyprenyl-6-hydroxyphenyl methylase/3-demethylubiquinone-9 3-methyltransferase